MITKAIIKRLCTVDNNHFSVYVPLLRKANADEGDATMEATLVCIPGIENTLQVGDVVYVAFEDDKFDKPIILGNLYKGQNTNKDEITTTLTTKSIEVTQVNKSPLNTTIGDIPVLDLQTKLNTLKDINHIEADKVIYSNEHTSQTDVKGALDELLDKDIDVDEKIEDLYDKVGDLQDEDETINGRIDDLVTDHITPIELDISNLKQEDTQIKSTLSSISLTISSIQTDIGTISSTVSGMESDITTLLGRHLDFTLSENTLVVSLKDN